MYQSNNNEMLSRKNAAFTMSSNVTGTEEFFPFCFLSSPVYETITNIAVDSEATKFIGAMTIFNVTSSHSVCHLQQQPQHRSRWF